MLVWRVVCKICGTTTACHMRRADLLNAVQSVGRAADPQRRPGREARPGRPASELHEADAQDAADAPVAAGLRLAEGPRYRPLKGGVVRCSGCGNDFALGQIVREHFGALTERDIDGHESPAQWPTREAV